MHVMERVSAATLDVQVVGVGVGAVVGTPAGAILPSPLLPLPDDELDVTVLPVGQVAGETVTCGGVTWGPIKGATAGVHTPRRTPTNSAAAVTAEVAAMRIGGNQVGQDAATPGARARRG